MIRSRARSSWAWTGAGRNSAALFVEPAQEPVGHAGDLVASENADDVVDLGKLLEQSLFLPLGQAAGDDHPPDVPRPLALEHLFDHADRFAPGGVDEPARVDDHQVGRLRIGHQRIAVLAQQSEHPLGIDQVFRAAQADERNRGCLRHGTFRPASGKEWASRSSRREPRANEAGATTADSIVIDRRFSRQ